MNNSLFNPTGLNGSKAVLFAYVMIDFRRLVLKTVEKALNKNDYVLLYSFKTDSYFIASKDKNQQGIKVE